MSVQGYSGSSPYAPLGSAFGLQVQPGEYTMSEYLEKADMSLECCVKKVASATLAIRSNMGDFYGNGVAIAEDLILVSGHCFEDTGWVGRFRGKVIFDGASAGLDFKIVQLEAGERLTPVTLDVTPECGYAIQIYFKEEGERLVRYVKSFETDMSPYAQRSSMATVSTNPGESGAPRMSLNTGHVYAIHQGDSEGLKVSDIYEVLEAAEERGGASGKVATEILDKIQIEGLETRHMNWSSIQLKAGDVREEKTRYKNTKTIGNTTFEYIEVGQGKEKRKIGIHVEGVKGPWVYYAIDPDPKTLNKYHNLIPKFYDSLGLALGESYVQHRTFPNEMPAMALNNEYILTKIES